MITRTPAELAVLHDTHFKLRDVYASMEAKFEDLDVELLDVAAHVEAELRPILENPQLLAIVPQGLFRNYAVPAIHPSRNDPARLKDLTLRNDFRRTYMDLIRGLDMLFGHFEAPAPSVWLPRKKFL